nr:class I SAM-dependent methyltransferase [Bacteroidota bacterium]
MTDSVEFMAQDDNSVPISAHELRDRELFNRISKDYCRKDLLPAHSIARQCRVEQTVNALPVSSMIDIIEVGCGAGFSTKYLRGTYHKYLGIDYSDELIKFAQAHNAGKGVEFQAINIKDLETKRRFDVVLLIGVLHHFENIWSLMDHMTSLLKPGGWIVANEPHGGNPAIRFSRAIRKKIDSKYSSKQVEFTISQLYNIFEGARLKEIKMIPQGIFSTPFAEVVMPLQKITTLISKCACSIDKIIERKYRYRLSNITWNIIAAGRKIG